MSKLSEGLVTLRGRWYQLLQALRPKPVPSVAQIYRASIELGIDPVDEGLLPEGLVRILDERLQWLVDHPGVCPPPITGYNIPRPTLSSRAKAKKIIKCAKALRDRGWKWESG